MWTICELAIKTTRRCPRTIHAGVLLRFVPLTAKRLTGIAAWTWHGTTVENHWHHLWHNFCDEAWWIVMNHNQHIVNTKKRKKMLWINSQWSIPHSGELDRMPEFLQNILECTTLPERRVLRACEGNRHRSAVVVPIHAKLCISKHEVPNWDFFLISFSSLEFVYQYDQHDQHGRMMANAGSWLQSLRNFLDVWEHVWPQSSLLLHSVAVPPSVVCHWFLFIVAMSYNVILTAYYSYPVLPIIPLRSMTAMTAMTAMTGEFCISTLGWHPGHLQAIWCVTCSARSAPVGMTFLHHVCW